MMQFYKKEILERWYQIRLISLNYTGKIISKTILHSMVELLFFWW